MKNKINNNQLSSGKVVKSTLWLFLFQVLDNVLGIIRLILLARLLSPTAFGLVGIAWLTLQIINTFTQTGIQQILIYKPKIDNLFLNVGWTFLVLRGIVLYAFILLIAPVVGNFFNSQDSIAVIQAISITILLEGFNNIGIIFFQRNLTFDKQFKLQISSNLIDFIVTLTLAFMLHNVWAIVYGAIAGSITRLILTYILSDYKPKLAWNLKQIKEMNDYGKWIGGSSILQFIYSQGDDILVGKVLNVTALGYYQLAYRISNLPATQITHIISSVMFPTYSKLQSSIEKVRSVYIINLQVVAYLSFLIGALIILFSYDFTVLFLGNQWLPIVVIMQLLTLWGVIRSIGATTGPVWQALGSPKTVTKIQTFQVAILVVIIYPLTVMYGIAGTSFAVVLSAFIPNIVTIKLISKTLKMSVNKVLSCLTYPFIASIFVAGVYLLLRTHVFMDTSYLAFILLAIICLLTYLIVTLLFSKFVGYEFYKILIEIVEKSKFAYLYKRYATIIDKLI